MGAGGDKGKGRGKEIAAGSIRGEALLSPRCTLRSWVSRLLYLGMPLSPNSLPIPPFPSSQGPWSSPPPSSSPFLSRCRASSSRPSARTASRSGPWSSPTTCSSAYRWGGPSRGRGGGRRGRYLGEGTASMRVGAITSCCTPGFSFACSPDTPSPWLSLLLPHGITSPP